MLGLANRVLAAGRVAADERLPGDAPRPPKRLVASLPGRARARDRRVRDRRGRAGRRSSTAVRALARDGTAHGAMAILVRTNAQLPAIEDALGAAGIPFHVRGERFFARPEVRRAVRVAAGARTRAPTSDATALGSDRLAGAFERELGVRRDAVPDGEAAARASRGGRHAARAGRGAVARTDPAADVAGVPRRGRAADRGRGRRRRRPASSC